MSNCRRPQVGQAIRTGPRSRSFSALRISQATLTSSSAWNVDSEMRIVSPIPSASSVPRPTADFSEPDHLVPASVTPRCSGYGIRSREQPVGGDRVGHGGRLHRDLEVREVQALHQLDGLDRGGDERLDGVLVLELAQVLGQRAGVDADRAAACRARLASAITSATFSGPPMLPGLSRTQCAPGLDRLQRERVVEVDVGDHRDRRLRDDGLERLGVFVARHRHADDVGAGLGDTMDLGHRRRKVGGLGLGHRLHRDRRAAADLHVSDLDVVLACHLRPVYER